jgi:hypothetical protein
MKKDRMRLERSMKPLRTKRLAVIGACCAWLAAGICPAQSEGKGIWPRAGDGLWYWVAPRSDLEPGQVDAVFRKAVDEETAFLDPKFSATLFLAKGVRLTKGKGRERKKYPQRPEMADVLQIEAEWRTGSLGQYRGASYCFIALDAVRGVDLYFLPDPRARYANAPGGRNWNVNILAGALYNFFFASEETARRFIDALASALRQRGLELSFSRFGLMWENVAPAQAADMGPLMAGQDGRLPPAGVLVTMVAAAGPADRAGIKPLDAVLAVDGTRVKNFSHFSLLLDGIPPAGRASLLLLRRLKDPAEHPEPCAWDTLTVEMEAR